MIEVREALPEDLPAIIELSQGAGDVRWNSNSFNMRAGGPFRRLVLVAHNPAAQHKLLGFLISRLANDECEIENIVIDHPARQQGIGSRLLREMIRSARSQSIMRVHLELRISNAAALALYKKFQFEVTGLRKDYYSSPQEDALLMSLTLLRE